MRQPGADRGNALAFALGQVADLGGKREVLLHLQRGPFLRVALVLVVAGGALPCGAGGALPRALGIGAGDALMPGRPSGRRPALLETAVFDMNGGGLAFAGKRLVQGRRDEGAEILRQHAALFDVVPFAGLRPEPLGGHAAGGRQHVAMEIALIALLAGLVDGEIRRDAVRVGKVPGNRIRHPEDGPPATVRRETRT